MANKYGDRSKDKPGYPALPINIALSKLLIEAAFKYALIMILTKNRIGMDEVVALNKILTKRPIIFEGGRVDFTEINNIETINTLVDEVWKNAQRVLFKEIASQDFHRGFVKKTADKV